MTAIDRPEFGVALNGLFAAWGREVGEAQLEAYWRYLSDLPMADVLTGIEQAARTAGRYVPTVGQIRDAVAGERPARSTARDYSGPTCEDCDGTGWVVSPVRSSLGYQQVRACSCVVGRTKRDTKYAAKGAA